MRKPMMAGNWKMNKLLGELDGFFTEFGNEAGIARGQMADKVDILFAVPSTMLQKARDIANTASIAIAAQNVHWEASGAYTGELSVAMIKDVKASATLIGHSERRQYFAETDETVAKKVAAALAGGVVPIACVGETLAERTSEKTMEVVERQVRAFLEPLDDPGPLIIAYEPVWAIGTGMTATSKQAQEVHAAIRKLVAEISGKAAADKMRILYGGSAKPTNIKELMDQPDIDGGLVGGASLKPADFAEMVRIASESA